MTEIPVYSVDTGIPVPEARMKGMPLRYLEVGQSILFPIEKRRSVAVSASLIGRKLGRAFTIRAQDKKNARVWRVS